jgi:hypothetical protein
MLLATFYFVFLPIGLVRGALGRDAMDRRLEPEAPSYWRPKRPPSDAGSYFRMS